MFGIKTRKINEQIDDLRMEIQILEMRGRSYGRRFSVLSARIRALEEATKPKSGKVKSDD